MHGLWRIVSGPSSQDMAVAIAAQRVVALEIEICDAPSTRCRVWAVFVRATKRHKTSTWEITSFYLYKGSDKQELLASGGRGEYDATRADGYPIKQSYVGRLHLD